MLDIQDILVGDTVYSVDFNTNEILTHEVFEKVDTGWCEPLWHLVTMVAEGEYQTYNVTLRPSDAFRSFEVALHSLLRVRKSEIDEATKVYENIVNNYN